jgi:hypothetical protein
MSADSIAAASGYLGGPLLRGKLYVSPLWEAARFPVCDDLHAPAVWRSSSEVNVRLGYLHPVLRYTLGVNTILMEDWK